MFSQTPSLAVILTMPTTTNAVNLPSGSQSNGIGSVKDQLVHKITWLMPDNMFTELLALTGAITRNPEDIKCLAAAIDSYMESTGEMLGYPITQILTLSTPTMMPQSLQPWDTSHKTIP